MQHVHELVNVLHGVVDDVDLGHLLVHGRTGHVLAQGLKGPVHGLDPVALPGVPLDGLEVLLGLDGVAMNWVEGHHLIFGRHTL